MMTHMHMKAATGMTRRAPEPFIAEYLKAHAMGDAQALYDLGVAYSTGSLGLACDFVEAHKWFNIAATEGCEEASWCRADIAEEMTAREIAEAQRQAREWLAASGRRAA
jgi:TPR repeat protein